MRAFFRTINTGIKYVAPNWPERTVRSHETELAVNQ